MGMHDSNTTYGTGRSYAWTVDLACSLRIASLERERIGLGSISGSLDAIRRSIQDFQFFLHKQHIPLFDSLFLEVHSLL